MLSFRLNVVSQFTVAKSNLTQLIPLAMELSYHNPSNAHRYEVSLNE